MVKFMEVVRIAEGPLREVPLYIIIYPFMSVTVSRTQVCIPGLHISLGVFLKLYTMLEGAAHELDVLIATVLERQPGQQQQLPHNFEQYVEERRAISALTEEANEALDHADFLDSLSTWALLSTESDSEDPQAIAMREEARNSRKKADELVRHST